MEKNRTYNSFKESGIALVTALIVVTASLLLVAGISYVLRGGWKIASLNKQYSTAQEAAGGGAEHAAEVIRLINNEGTTTSMGINDLNDAQDVIFYCNTANDGALIRAQTANGRFTINMTVRCVESKPIPGSSGAMVFPPPPSFGSGGMPSYYIFYSIVSEAKDSSNSSIGRIEAVYRLAR